MANKDERGFWQNKNGEFTHPDMVGADKQLEDELVEKLVASAKKMSDKLMEFKIQAYADCYDFVDLLKQDYGLDRLAKSKKLGSVTLKNYSGTMDVQIHVNKLIQFDQKLSLAKEKIDEYLNEKTEHADPEIRTLITKAFDVKNGKVDVKQILSLKQYPITAKKWQEAMSMIDAATEIVGTKSYIRFKERKGGLIDGDMQNIVLDFAALNVSTDTIIEEQSKRANIKTEMGE